MSLKNFLIVAVMLVVFNGILLYSGVLDRLIKTNEEVSTPQAVDPDIVDVFRFTLEDEVKKKIGTPIEGYEPQMFLDVFPGLVETDFAGVEASIGQYSIVEGRIRHEIDNTKLIHSAATAITRKGMSTLLDNVANRTEIDLNDDGTITDIMSVLTAN